MSARGGSSSASGKAKATKATKAAPTKRRTPAQLVADVRKTIVQGSDKWKTSERAKRVRTRLISAVSSLDGTLVGGCLHCAGNSCLPMEQFAPPECNNNGRNRPLFFEAMEEYREACEAQNSEAECAARANVEKYRIARCPPCQGVYSKLSPAEQECNNEYKLMRKTACAKQGGCLYPNCVERGEQAWCVLQGDHVHPKNHPNPKLRKEEGLSAYNYWAYHGGVPAMRREVAKGMNWPCRFCHNLEPTTPSANKCSDPESMLRGKWNGTSQEQKQYEAHRKATIVYPKEQYVDRVKREVRKQCAHCARAVLLGQEHAFIFDHLDPSTKMKGKDTLAGKDGGVAGLVGNCAREAERDKIKPLLDAEMAKCQLLCANCDHRKTHKYPKRRRRFLQYAAHQVPRGG